MHNFTYKSYARFLIYICSKANYMFLYILMPSIFVYDPVCVMLRTLLWIPWRYWFSLPAPVLLCICLPLYRLRNVIVFSVISITTILNKLWLMIWSYLTSFVVCQSVSLCLHLRKIYTQIIKVLCHIRFILVGSVVPVISWKLEILRTACLASRSGKLPALILMKKIVSKKSKITTLKVNNILTDDNKNFRDLSIF